MLRPFSRADWRIMPAPAQRMVDLIRRWGPTIGKYTLVQLCVQLLGACAGLLIVRTLPKQEYAFYTLAGALVPTLCSLATSGITYAASAVGGRVWEDRRRLGQVAVTAFKVSRVQAAVSAVPVLAIFAWLLHRNGASLATGGAILVLALAAAVSQFAAGLLTVVPRLKGDFQFLQRTEISATVLRLVLVAVAAWVWLNAELAVLITGVANAFRWLKIRSWVRSNVDLSAPADPVMAAEMRQVMMRQWLNEVYYVTQGHISLYLLSIFGGVANVANFGALGRVGVLFAAPGVAMQNIVLPRFARCQEPERLRQLYVQIFAANALVAASPVVLALALPRLILWVLGPQYSGLSYELFLYALSLAMAMLSDAAGGLNAVRAWIVPGWIVMPVWLVTQFVLMAVVGVASLPQVLWISVVTNAVLAGVYLSGAIYFGRAFARSVPSADSSSSGNLDA
jgi:O-antigen/teichoic acid export membrane protein